MRTVYPLRIIYQCKGCGIRLYGLDNSIVSGKYEYCGRCSQLPNSKELHKQDKENNKIEPYFYHEEG